MARSAIASLGVSLVARTKGFKKGLARAKRQTADFTRSMSRTVPAIAAASAAFTGLSSAASGLSFAKTSDFFAGLAKTGSKLDIPVKNLIALRDIADISEVSVSQLEMGLQRMTRRVSEAALGSGVAVKALQELGLSAASLNRLRTDQQFARIGEALRNVKRPADQVRLAFKLFDSEGVNLLETLKAMDNNGLQKILKSNKEIGRSFTAFDQAKVLQVRESLTRVSQAAEALSVRFGLLLAPVIKVVSDRLFKMSRDGKAGIEGLAASATPFLDVAEKIEVAFKRVLNIVNRMLEIHKAFARFAGGLAKEALDKVFGKGRTDEAVNAVAQAFDNAKNKMTGFFKAVSGGEKVKSTIAGLREEVAKAAKELDKGAKKAAGKQQARRSQRSISSASSGPKTRAATFGERGRARIAELGSRASQKAAGFTGPGFDKSGDAARTKLDKQIDLLTQIRDKLPGAGAPVLVG